MFEYTCTSCELDELLPLHVLLINDLYFCYSYIHSEKEHASVIHVCQIKGMTVFFAHLLIMIIIILLNNLLLIILYLYEAISITILEHFILSLKTSHQ